MKKSIVETILGAIVLAVACIFLVFSYSSADVGSADGYALNARFSSIGGLNVGDKVVISGVKVGTVSDIDLENDSYLAIVHLNIDNDYKLPEDTAAFISSESLLGGLYLQLEPGAAEEMILPGGTIQYTQAPQNLEQLLGEFIFSMQGNGDQ